MSRNKLYPNVKVNAFSPAPSVSILKRCSPYSDPSTKVYKVFSETITSLVLTLSIYICAK